MNSPSLSTPSLTATSISPPSSDTDTVITLPDFTTEIAAELVPEIAVEIVAEPIMEPMEESMTDTTSELITESMLESVMAIAISATQAEDEDDREVELNRLFRLDCGSSNPLIAFIPGAKDEIIVVLDHQVFSKAVTNEVCFFEFKLMVSFEDAPAFSCISIKENTLLLGSVDGSIWLLRHVGISPYELNCMEESLCKYQRPHSKEIAEIICHPGDEPFLLSRTDSEVFLWRTVTDSELCCFSMQIVQSLSSEIVVMIEQIVFSADGEWIFALLRNNTFVRWTIDLSGLVNEWKLTFLRYPSTSARIIDESCHFCLLEDSLIISSLYYFYLIRQDSHTIDRSCNLVYRWDIDAFNVNTPNPSKKCSPKKAWCDPHFEPGVRTFGLAIIPNFIVVLNGEGDFILFNINTAAVIPISPPLPRARGFIMSPCLEFMILFPFGENSLEVWAITVIDDHLHDDHLYLHNDHLDDHLENEHSRDEDDFSNKYDFSDYDIDNYDRTHYRPNIDQDSDSASSYITEDESETEFSSEDSFHTA